MGDTILKCLLCCGKTFDSKPALIRHLSEINENIACPICLMKWSSIWHLIEHLSDDNCRLDRRVDAPSSNVEKNKESSQSLGNENHMQVQQTQRVPLEYEKYQMDTFSPSVKGTPNNSLEMGQMYVEFLSKPTQKQLLQTQELKLVKDGGGSRYMLVAEQNPNMDAESTIVTKQNNDGTISLTTVRDMKMEPDTVISPENQEPEKNQDEIYSCNTCGVSFTSVLEHIQNYHNDQDVVVEEPMDEDTGMGISLQFEEEPADKQISRRMITETGDIVETPIDSSPTDPLALDSEVSQLVQQQNSENAANKKGKGRKRYTLVEKFCDSVVMDINKPEEKDKNGPYHKVVIKEMDTSHGDKMKVFNCISCNVYASSLDQFKSHPCKVLRYSCPYCLVSYENSKSLCAHMKVHKNRSPTTTVTEPPVTSFVCEFCSTVFPTNKSLKLHKRMHDPVKVRPIEPPVENPQGGEVSTKKYLCPTCDKMIPLDYRIIHQNSHDTDVDQFNCDICNKKFTSAEYLDMHMNVHSAEKVAVNNPDKYLPYTCCYCERRFARPHEKVKHERIHTGEKPHACEICGKSFRVSYCLTLHMRTHTGARPYSCPHCGKRFKAHSVYNHHLLTHSEVRAYKCPYCPKAFKTSVQLAGHKNSHTKPFSCQQCNRPFASLYAVRVHMETHSRQNNLKYSCIMCGASYARAFALNDHIKQAHEAQGEAAKDLTLEEENTEMPVVVNLKYSCSVCGANFVRENALTDHVNKVHNGDIDKSERLTAEKEDETDWVVQQNNDGVDLQLTKELTHESEINDLGIISSNELVVP